MLRVVSKSGPGYLITPNDQKCQPLSLDGFNSHRMANQLLKRAMTTCEGDPASHAIIDAAVIIEGPRRVHLRRVAMADASIYLP